MYNTIPIRGRKYVCFEDYRIGYLTTNYKIDKNTYVILEGTEGILYDGGLNGKITYVNIRGNFTKYDYINDSLPKITYEKNEILRIEFSEFQKYFISVIEHHLNELLK